MIGRQIKKITRSGFTLVEILMAIFILGLVMATAYVSYNGTLKVSHQMEEEGNIYKMARVSMSRMIKDLPSLQSYNGSFYFRAEKKQLNKKVFYFLSFWSAAHLDFGENGSIGRPASISYYVREDEGGNSYSLWRSDVYSVKPDKIGDTENGFVICRNVDTFRLTFYDSAGKETVSWYTSSSTGGDQGAKLPAAMKIELFIVNVNDQDNPYKFMTKVNIPLKKQTP